MNVLLIDSGRDRRNNIYKFILSQSYDCMAFPQVNGQEQIESGVLWENLKNTCGDLISQKNYDALLIHHNSNQNPFWDDFVRLCCTSSELWAVSYSGGLRVKSVHERHHPFAGNVGASGQARWDLGAFLRAIDSHQGNPFDALTRFDPVLEAKLELLHACLTPPTSEEARKKLEELKTEIRNAGTILSSIVINARWRTEGETEKIFSGNIDAAINALSNETDCFSFKYVAILSEIRDKLLAD